MTDRGGVFSWIGNRMRRTHTPPDVPSDEEKVLEWIAEVAPDRSFCDIGGIGMAARNERISVALEKGARKATMVDARPFAHPDWEAFREKVRSADPDRLAMVEKADLESKEFAQSVGRFDVVHSTGILYHAPAPIRMIENLVSVTGEHLIVNTIIVPTTIRNDAGRIDLPDSAVVFLPALSAGERRVFEAYYQEKLGWPEGRFTSFVPAPDDRNASMPWIQRDVPKDYNLWKERGSLSYTPFWWFFTKPAFRSALTLFGLEILDETSREDHALTCLCRKSG